MLVKLSTNKSVSETAAALQAAVQVNHFGVMQVHNLQETMVKKGVDFERECLIFEANDASGDVQLAATGRRRAGSGGHDYENYEGGGIKLLMGWPLGCL